jgi:hypothetical protein
MTELLTTGRGGDSAPDADDVDMGDSDALTASSENDQAHTYVVRLEISHEGRE